MFEISYVLGAALAVVSALLIYYVFAGRAAKVEMLSLERATHGLWSENLELVSEIRALKNMDHAGLQRMAAEKQDRDPDGRFS